MRALVACEYSGRVRRELERVGFEAWSCDLLPSEDESPRHIVGDVSAMLREPWDLVIAHPPCTRLANSGVRWLHERDLWQELDEAAAFFKQCLNANALPKSGAVRLWFLQPVKLGPDLSSLMVEDAKDA